MAQPTLKSLIHKKVQIIPFPRLITGCSNFLGNGLAASCDLSVTEQMVPMSGSEQVLQQAWLGMSEQHRACRLSRWEAQGLDTRNG